MHDSTAIQSCRTALSDAAFQRRLETGKVEYRIASPYFGPSLWARRVFNALFSGGPAGLIDLAALAAATQLRQSTITTELRALVQAGCVRLRGAGAAPTEVER